MKISLVFIFATLMLTQFAFADNCLISCNKNNHDEISSCYTAHRRCLAHMPSAEVCFTIYDICTTASYKRFDECKEYCAEQKADEITEADCKTNCTSLGYDLTELRWGRCYQKMACHVMEWDEEAQFCDDRGTTIHRMFIPCSSIPPL